MVRECARVSVWWRTLAHSAQTQLGRRVRCPGLLLSPCRIWPADRVPTAPALAASCTAASPPSCTYHQQRCTSRDVEGDKYVTLSMASLRLRSPSKYGCASPLPSKVLVMTTCTLALRASPTAGQTITKSRRVSRTLQVPLKSHGEQQVDHSPPSISKHDLEGGFVLRLCVLLGRFVSLGEYHDELLDSPPPDEAANGWSARHELSRARVWDKRAWPPRQPQTAKPCLDRACMPRTRPPRQRPPAEQSLPVIDPRQ
jgi:hypothetical protein